MSVAPLRITWVLPAPELNGGVKVVLQHAELLRKAGHRSTVLGAGPRQSWFPRRLRYVDIGLGPPRLPSQDLVIATFWTTIDVALALRLGPVTHLCQGYEGALVHLRAQWPEIEARYALPLPAFAVAPHLSELLRIRFGRESRLVPPSLDPRFRPGWRRGPSRRPRIFVPGIFEAEVKGVATALEAVRRLRERGVDARVVRLSLLPPSDAERRLLVADAYLRGALPRVVARRLRRSDLLILASREAEGFGLPLLEAMASGVPAVASRIAATAFASGGSVERVPADDSVAFADAAERLLTDPRAWRRARDVALVAAQRFHPEAVLRQLLLAVEWARAAGGGQIRSESPIVK
jgi:glycosyltransferase involved in cell wall biosynthesis